MQHTCYNLTTQRGLYSPNTQKKHNQLVPITTPPNRVNFAYESAENETHHSRAQLENCGGDANIGNQMCRRLDGFLKMVSAARRESDSVIASYSGSATSFRECLDGIVFGSGVATALQAFFDHADHRFAVLGGNSKSPHFVEAPLRLNLDVADEKEYKACESDLEQHEQEKQYRISLKQANVGLECAEAPKYRDHEDEDSDADDYRRNRL